MFLQICFSSCSYVVLKFFSFLKEGLSSFTVLSLSLSRAGSEASHSECLIHILMPRLSGCQEYFGGLV